MHTRIHIHHQSPGIPPRQHLLHARHVQVVKPGGPPGVRQLSKLGAAGPQAVLERDVLLQQGQVLDARLGHLRATQQRQRGAALD